MDGMSLLPLIRRSLLAGGVTGALLSELPVSLEQPGTPLLTLILRCCISWQNRRGAD